MTYFQAASGLWDSNGAGNRYMDQLLSTGNAAGLRAYTAQLRAISAEMEQLERDYRDLARDLEQAWPQGRARHSWVSLADDTARAYESMRRVVSDGDQSLAGITDRHADELQSTQTSSMTKSILVNALLAALNSNPYTSSLVSPTGAMATIETVAELAQVASTINTFYDLYNNLTGDDESHEVRQSDSRYASAIPMARAGYEGHYVPAVGYSPGQYPQNGPYVPAAGYGYSPGQYPQNGPYVPAAGYGYSPGQYPQNGPYVPSGYTPTGGYDPYGGYVPSSGFPSTGNVVPATGYVPAGGGGAVPGFTPVDPGTAAGPGDTGTGTGTGTSHAHGHAHGHQGSGFEGVTVTIRDGDASFQVTTDKDGHFDGKLHGQKVSVDVDVADDPAPRRRTG
ncbi:MAG: hypothetical protein HY830_26945 [Actinobacteria bacterium]|nr:hypothetical protein [Actinomycetota bacterium]